MIDLFFLTCNIFLTPVFFIFFLFLRLYSHIKHEKLDQCINQKLGLYPSNFFRNVSTFPKIWIHAVSVGEIQSALPIIKSLISLAPNCSIILSTSTKHGYAFAQQRLKSIQLKSKAICIYAPIDFVFCVRKVLSAIKPDVLVFIETEIWPNWLAQAKKMGIKIVMANGRISVRAIKKYLKFKPFIKEILKNIDAFSMITKQDAERIMMMGASKNKVKINGNSKYDISLNSSNENIAAQLKNFYNLKNEPVFIAGSTRNPEEKIILDVYEKIIQSFPETVLFIAPRHIKRANFIKKIVKERGILCQLRTDIDVEKHPRTASVVIIDTIGELHAIYSIASIVFCGASLVSLGGQNILEPAIWGKPVFYGPSMEDFLDAKQLLDKTGGGIQVKDGNDLAQKALCCLANPCLADMIGKQAKKAAMTNKGAANRHADVIGL